MIKSVSVINVNCYVPRGWKLQIQKLIVRLLTVNNKRCFSRKASNHVFCITNVKAFVHGLHVVDEQGLVVQNPSSTKRHFAIFPSPDDVGHRLSVHHALENHPLPRQGDRVLGLLVQDRLNCILSQIRPELLDKGL